MAFFGMLPPLQAEAPAPAVTAALVGAFSLLLNGLLVIWAQHAARRLANVQAQTTLDTAAASSRRAMEEERAATLELSRNLREELKRDVEQERLDCAEQLANQRRELQAIQRRLRSVELENQDLRILLLNHGITPPQPRSPTELRSGDGGAT